MMSTCFACILMNHPLQNVYKPFFKIVTQTTILIYMDLNKQFVFVSCKRRNCSLQKDIKYRVQAQVKSIKNLSFTITSFNRVVSFQKVINVCVLLTSNCFSYIHVHCTIHILIYTIIVPVISKFNDVEKEGKASVEIDYLLAFNETVIVIQ